MSTYIPTFSLQGTPGYKKDLVDVMSTSYDIMPGLARQWVNKVWPNALTLGRQVKGSEALLRRLRRKLPPAAIMEIRRLAGAQWYEMILEELASYAAVAVTQEQELNMPIENPGVIVTLIFNRKGQPKWTNSRAQAWARSHGYHSGDKWTTITPSRIHIQQVKRKPANLRTVAFGKGIKAIMGWTDADWNQGPPDKTRKTQRAQASARRRSPRAVAAKKAAKKVGSYNELIHLELPGLVEGGKTSKEAMQILGAKWQRMKRGEE